VHIFPFLICVFLIVAEKVVVGCWGGGGGGITITQPETSPLIGTF